GRFADLAAAANTPAARRVGALALARFAEMVPEPLAVRARADAARAFLEAGDRAAARDVLERVARDSAAPADAQALAQSAVIEALDRKSTRLNSSHDQISYAVFCLKKKTNKVGRNWL